MRDVNDIIRGCAQSSVHVHFHLAAQTNRMSANEYDLRIKTVSLSNRADPHWIDTTDMCEYV